jgi:hypothetical protein
MICANCGHSARAGAAFCGECGSSLRYATVVPESGVASSALLPPPPPPPKPTVLPREPTRTSLLAPPPPPPPPPRPSTYPVPEIPAQQSWTPEPADEIATPVAVPSVATDGMITPPASIAMPTSLASVPQTPPVSEVLFVTSPFVSQAAGSGVAARLVPQNETDLDATRVSVRRRVGSPWRLVLPDGRHHVVEKAVLVGRDAAPNAKWPGAQLLSVADGTKSVSKTHAVIEVDSEGLWVTDLASTNGVIVTTPDGGETDLDGDQRVRVEPGCDIELGDYIIQVEKD